MSQLFSFVFSRSDCFVTNFLLLANIRIAGFGMTPSLEV